jgi:hypothetical protein
MNARPVFLNWWSGNRFRPQNSASKDYKVQSIINIRTPSLGREVNVVDLRHVKEPYNREKDAS